MTRSTQRPLSVILLLLLIALSVSGCARTGATAPAERVRIDRVVLLSTEAQISANLTVEQLAAFIREAQAQLAQTVALYTGSSSLSVVPIPGMAYRRNNQK